MAKDQAGKRRRPVDPGGPTDREFHLRRVIDSMGDTISPEGALRLLELFGKPLPGDRCPGDD